MTLKTFVRTIFLCCAATLSCALPAAADLYAAGDLAGACGQVDSALRKMDGVPKPPDFVAYGIDPNVDGLASLYQQVANLKILFGCP